MATDHPPGMVTPNSHAAITPLNKCHFLLAPFANGMTITKLEVHGRHPQRACEFSELTAFV